MKRLFSFFCLPRKLGLSEAFSFFMTGKKRDFTLKIVDHKEDAEITQMKKLLKDTTRKTFL